MLKNYLKIAFRNIRTNKIFSVINMSGLAIGLASCILIYLYINDEMSYDKFHENHERIFRVLTIDRALGVSSSEVGITLPALGPAIKDRIPEVVDYVRFNRNGRALLSYNNNSLYSTDLIFAENSIFDVFSLPFVKGDKNTGIKNPNSAVLTETMAKRLFGDEDPIGKSFTINTGNTVQVTGIMKDLDQNSHMRFDVIVSRSPTAQQQGLANYLNSWGSISMVVYALLDRPESMDAVIEKMEPILRENNVGSNFSVTLQPMTDAHLKSTHILFDINNQNKGDMSYIYTLSAVAFFILLIATINFMNLSTAKSSNRAREVGMRKVAGANRSQLIFQHIGESILLCVISFIIALGLIAAFGHQLSAPSGNPLSLNALEGAGIFITMIGLVFLIGFIAGWYPALVLSAFKPIQVLKGAFRSSATGILIRRVLVVSQFAASIAMIIGTGIVSDQIDFIKNMKVGYNRDQVLSLSMNNQQLQQGLNTFREKVANHTSITATALSNTLPGRAVGRTGIQPEGQTQSDPWILSIMTVDDKFIDAMGMELAAGRNFSTDITTDQQQSILLNEAAIRALGWMDDPIGKTITFGAGGNNPVVRNVIGVVKDFNFATVRHKIEPLIMQFQPATNGTLSLRLNANDISGSIAFVENAWKEVFPTQPFEFTFLDAEFDQQYRSEGEFQSMMGAFTFLAIFIACLGLFGLASFTAEQKTKEFGVRKVLGASVPNLTFLISKDFAKWVVVSNLIAWPAAFFVMNRWLGEFAYRTDINPMLFIYSAILALLIAMLTVSYQALKASTGRPVDALRYE